MLLLNTLLAGSNVIPDLVILVTVRVYVPRPLLVVNRATPELLVVAVLFCFVPLGRVQVAYTVAPETVAPF